MRRALVLTVMCCVGIVPVAAAQERHVGIKAGVAAATVAFDPDQDSYKLRIAAAGGVFGVFPLGPRVGLQLEGLLIQKGTSADVVVEGVEAASTLALDYFEVPVLARVGGPRVGGSTLHLYAGPYAAVRLSAKSELSSTDGVFTSGYSDDIREFVKLFDYGVVAGVGLDLRKWIVFDARYSWGLADINDDPDLTSTLKNRAATFMVGIRF